MQFVQIVFALRVVGGLYLQKQFSQLSLVVVHYSNYTVFGFYRQSCHKYYISETIYAKTQHVA